MSRQINPDEHASELADLKPAVREQAVQFANELLRKDEELTHADALRRGIKMAERWYLDRAG